ncbi:NADH dehydrogenase [ubiquinone] 1 beta subcomplex subunit 8, mitochondrial-like [Acanthaster planci]|uniref:NADH dehydrogenase [ubiquinone] 1 beta subcomplex subunit 8, mitochondrial-like n=1 Tax=Acanthaster planci TaxID=133434 RepID=A0A8B7YRI2_ACAPL|nr:NADH dehydrogenase [ubiquinone] 1 beta subcomplex subunit 8, mitochondrial-like [Acanthaster planci]XP_022094012.1 NADH dehydrogenase [ubiquinone] 1 beta subcomplex subunit 8, mitochondrial-like [Acanthaster planci]
MASLCRFCLRKPANVSTVARVISARYATFTEDDLPGTFPKTPQERAAAAKKYGMRVEDYEPYPDDGLGWGDYPKAPDIHDDDKDPHADWDFPEERRNFGELVHIEQDLLSRARPNIYAKSRIPFNQQVKMLGAVLATLAVLFWFGGKYKIFQPVGPKQYPYNDLWIEKGNQPEDAAEPKKHYVI